MTKANRQFTDRTEPQAAFQKAYLDMANHAPEENRSRVITYYGMGGIGKSRLLERLKENLSTDPSMTAKNKRKPLVVYFDFEKSTDGVLILEHLCKVLKEEYKWNFSRFEWGLHYYRKAIGEKTQEPHIKSFLEAHPQLQTPAGLLSKFPVVGTFVDAGKTGDEFLAWARNQLKPHEDFREKFDKLTPKEQQAELLGLFAEDLNKYAKDIPAPVVFLLDTYERIPEGNDWWLRGENGQGGLICLTKNTLWVIAGRHKVQWKVKDCDMEQHLLGDLSYEDAGAFLTGAGIPQDWLPTLYKLTGGTPVYLDVCVDRYKQLQQPDKTPELSQFDLGDPTILLRRYVEDLDPRVKEMVYMLSFIPLWDKKLVRSAAEKVLWGSHVADFHRVTELSITHSLNQADHTEQIHYTDDTEHTQQTLYFIHRTVAETLRNDPKNKSREDTAEFLIDHFLPMLDSEPPYSEAYSHALKNILHGGMLLHEDRTDLAEFYRTTMHEPQNILCRCHRDDVVEELFAPFWERAAENPSDFLYATALYEKAWHTSQRIRGRRSRSRKDDIFAWTIESLYLLHKLNMEDHVLVPEALEAIATNHTEPGYDGCLDFPMAFALHRYAIHLYKTKHPHDQIALILCRRNLAKAYQLAKDYDAAGPLLLENLELAEETLEPGNRYRLQALQDLADFYSLHGDLEKALERSKQVLEQRTTYLPKKDPDTIRSMINLAHLHYQMGNLPEAAAIREKVLSFYRKHLPLDYPEITSAINALADIYQQLQAYPKELLLREELLERDRKEYGDNSGLTLRRVRALANVYHNLQWLDKRNTLYVDWCKTLAKGYRMAWLAQDLLDSAVDDFQDHALGKQLCQILIQTDPQNSVYAKHQVADWYYHRGEFQEALDILTEILENEPKDSDWRDNAMFLRNRILVEMGQEPDAWYKELVSSWHSDWRGRKPKPEMILSMKDSANKSPISMDFTGLSLLEVLIKVCEKKSDARIQNLRSKLWAELPTSSEPHSLFDLIAANPNWGDGPQIFTKFRPITEEDPQ